MGFNWNWRTFSLFLFARQFCKSWSYFTNILTRTTVICWESNFSDFSFPLWQDCGGSMSKFLFEVAELNSLRSIEGSFYSTTPPLVFFRWLNRLTCCNAMQNCICFSYSFLLFLSSWDAFQYLTSVYFTVFAQKAQRPENIYVPRERVKKGKSEVHPENLSANPKSNLLR